jgi:hypothetical protein
VKQPQRRVPGLRGVGAALANYLFAELGGAVHCEDRDHRVELPIALARRDVRFQLLRHKLQALLGWDAVVAGDVFFFC